MTIVVLILAALIVGSLVIVTLDRLTRPARLARIRREDEHLRELDDEPIAGLQVVAAQEGWEGPLADAPIGDARARATISELTGALQPRRRTQVDLELERVVHAYAGAVQSKGFLIGNAVVRAQPYIEGSSDPIPHVEHLTTALCELALARSYPPLLVGELPESIHMRRAGTGVQEFDRRYRVRRPFVPAMLCPDLVAYLATREGWALWVHEDRLLVLRRTGLASGDDARSLLEQTLHVASLLPDPFSSMGHGAFAAP